MLIVLLNNMFYRGGVRFNIRKYCTSVPKHARILASDSIEKVCGDVFRARGHELVEKPGISKADLLKVIGEFDGLVVRSNTKVTKEVIEAGTHCMIHCMPM
jgi:phosphoglycerate dehydrogenase-like enzyme